MAIGRTISRPVIYGALIAAFIATLSVAARSTMVFATSDAQSWLGRNALWYVISDLCVPSSRIGLTFPCSSVHRDTSGKPDWATLPVAAGHVLTVPTDRISGVESPAARGEASAGYWEAAWDARSLIERAFGQKLARSSVALVINSHYSRSQDQLHIHTSCATASVQSALGHAISTISDQWARLQTPINGVHFMARRVLGDSLEGINVIDLLPKSVTTNVRVLARQTLVVVGASFPDAGAGYIILNADVGPGSDISGEDLLDFKCRQRDPG